MTEKKIGQCENTERAIQRRILNDENKEITNPTLALESRCVATEASLP